MLHNNGTDGELYRLACIMAAAYPGTVPVPEFLAPKLVAGNYSIEGDYLYIGYFANGFSGYLTVSSVRRFVSSSFNLAIFQAASANTPLVFVGYKIPVAPVYEIATGVRFTATGYMYNSDYGAYQLVGTLTAVTFYAGQAVSRKAPQGLVVLAPLSGLYRFVQFSYGSAPDGGVLANDGTYYSVTASVAEHYSAFGGEYTPFL